MEAAEAIEDRDGNKVLPVAATELLVFRIYFPGNGAYGKPRYTSMWPDILGLREVAEENRLVVTDTSIPNMILALSGPRVDTAEVDRVEKKLSERGPSEKGVVVLNATTSRTAGASTGTAQVQPIKLRDVQNMDGLGLNYQDLCYRKLCLAYRLPRTCVGDDKDINRSSAFGMFRFAENQTYDPERDEFDDVINSSLLPELDIQFLKYKTQGRAPKDPELLANIISILAKAGVLTPDEGRELAEQIFNRDFKDLQGAWTQLPITILNAVLQTKNKLTAAAILTQGEGDDFLSQLREAVVRDLEESGLKLQAQQAQRQQPAQQPQDAQGGVQGSRSEDNAQRENPEAGGADVQDGDKGGGEPRFGGGKVPV